MKRLTPSIHLLEYETELSYHQLGSIEIVGRLYQIREKKLCLPECDDTFSFIRIYFDSSSKLYF
jgi:hypothetical protein